MLRFERSTIEVHILLGSGLPIRPTGPSDSMLRALAKELDTSFEDLKQLDDWPAFKEIKRRILTDPKFMFAVRRLLDANVPAEALIKLAEDKGKRKKK